MATRTPAIAPQVTTVLTVALLSDNSVNLVVSNRHGKWPLRLTEDEAGDDNFCWSTLYIAQVGLAVNGRMSSVRQVECPTQANSSELFCGTPMTQNSLLAR